MGEGLRRTPLWPQHSRDGAKLVGFAGWEMPIQYPAGQLKEHEIVRTSCGIFDVSHMGRYFIGGTGSIDFLQSLLTNDIVKAAPGQLIYSPVCNPAGGVIDDVTVYRFASSCLMVVNASNRRPMWEWLESRKPSGVVLEDRSDAWGQIAVQGPKAQEMLAPLVGGDLEAIGYYRHAPFTLQGKPDVLISRNGYTGEDGFEIYLPATDTAPLWDALIQRGAAAIGLGARDTLRMEMCYALYGNELDTATTPLEAGLGWTVKLKKGEFIGRDVLLRQKEQGVEKILVGFEVAGPRPGRHGQAILHEGRPVGVVTSGGPCPSLGNRGMGLGYVPPALAAKGTRIGIDVRGTLVDAVVCERPFYKNASHR